jgi:hypothetical protein
MARVWKIIVHIERVNEKPDLTEWFLVGAADPKAAAQTLRARRDLFDAHQHLEIVGEADENFLASIGAENIKPGQVYPVVGF